MMDITSANAIYMLSIAGLYPVPQQVQGFAADDIFDTESIDPAEVVMGADGRLSAGFVFVPTKQGIALQADSSSSDFFEGWYLAQQTAQRLYFAGGIVQLPSIGRAYAMTKGVLTTYPNISDAKKTLQPRKYGITWERIVPSPL